MWLIENFKLYVASIIFLNITNLEIHLQNANLLTDGTY